MHLGRIAKNEGATVSEEGLALIARAAEGSVRDGLSILDQAIVQTLVDSKAQLEHTHKSTGWNALMLALKSNRNSAVAEMLWPLN